MKKVMSFILVGVFVLAFAFCYGNSVVEAKESGSDDYEKLNLKLSTSGTNLGVDAITAQYFADAVKEASGGKIKIRVYPNCQLAGGSMPKSIELLIVGGNYELAVFSGSVLGNIDARFLTHSVPFIFSSYAEAIAKMDSLSLIHISSWSS